MGKQIQLVFVSISIFLWRLPTRMMAQYYTKIRLGRMATLLALTEAETEDCLSDMVWFIITSIIMHHYANIIMTHRSWDQGFSLRDDSHHHLHQYAPLIIMQISWLTEAETKGYLLEMVWNSNSSRSSPSHSLFWCNYVIQTLNSFWLV